MTCYLALDTATDRGSVAVGKPGSILAEVVVGPRRHAAELMPAIEATLRTAGQSLNDLSGLLVADGPGSFTGLRIAFATAQGIVRQRPDLTVMTVPSLLSAARVASGVSRGVVAALYDALRGEVFAAVYQFAGDGVTTLIAPGLATVSALQGSEIRPDLAVGDGAVAYAGQVRSWTGREPLALSDLGALASGLIELLRTPDIFRVVENVSAWEPQYGRLAEAQVRWERQHGKPLQGSAGDRR